jgi:hypothetical protein
MKEQAFKGCLPPCPATISRIDFNCSFSALRVIILPPPGSSPRRAIQPPPGGKNPAIRVIGVYRAGCLPAIKEMGNGRIQLRVAFYKDIADVLKVDQQADDNGKDAQRCAYP